jgi:hypothetical protein
MSRISDAFRKKSRLVDGIAEPVVPASVAAALAVLPLDTVRRWCRAQEGRSTEVGRTIYLTEASVLALAEETRTQDRLYAELVSLRERVRRLETELERRSSAKTVTTLRRKNLSETVKSIREKNKRDAGTR